MFLLRKTKICSHIFKVCLKRSINYIDLGVLFLLRKTKSCIWRTLWVTLCKLYQVKHYKSHCCCGVLSECIINRYFSWELRGFWTLINSEFVYMLCFILSCGVSLKLKALLRFMQQHKLSNLYNTKMLCRKMQTHLLIVLSIYCIRVRAVGKKNLNF